MEGVETNSKESVITLVFFSKAKPLNEFLILTNAWQQWK